MKKHPIDDLFAQRLAGHSLTPTRASWEEMQRRMPQKASYRIGARRWYAVAAAVLLLLGTGWLRWYWPVQPANSVGAVRAVPLNVPKPLPIPQKPEADDRRYARVEKKYRRTRPVSILEHAESNQKSGQSSPPRADEALPAPEAVVPPLELAASPPPTLETGAEKVLIVAIDEPLQEAEMAAAEAELPRKKRIRPGRLLRQLNNLRTGKPIDWEDAGMDRTTLVAKASQAVETGRERLTESYETFRSKTFNPQNSK